jgi:hypothetical protein
VSNDHAFTQYGYTLTSGATAYYVGIWGNGPSVPCGGVPPVWIVHNSPVTIC